MPNGSWSQSIQLTRWCTCIALSSYCLVHEPAGHQDEPLTVSTTQITQVAAGARPASSPFITCSAAASSATRLQVAHLLRHVPWRHLAPSPRPKQLRPQAVSQELLPETDSGALSSEDDVEAEESSSAFGRLSSPVSADPDRQTASSSAQDSNPYSNLASTSSSAAASSILSIPGWSAAGVQAAGIKRVKPLYNTERWSYHRDTSRYFRHLAGLFQSSTFRKLRLPLLYLTANAAVICTYLSMQDTGMLPAGLPIVKVSVQNSDKHQVSGKHQLSSASSCPQTSCLPW